MKIIFNKALSEEEIKELETEFQKWVKEEYAKRIIKKGKLFSFNITTDDELKSISFGNTQFIYTGDSSVGFIESLNLFEKYEKMLQNMVEFLKNFVSENKLHLLVSPSDGLAKYYTVLR